MTPINRIKIDFPLSNHTVTYIVNTSTISSFVFSQNRKTNLNLSRKGHICHHKRQLLLRAPPLAAWRLVADDGGARLVIGAWPQLTPGDQGGLIRWQRLVTSLRGLLGAELVYMVVIWRD